MNFMKTNTLRSALIKRISIVFLSLLTSVLILPSVQALEFGGALHKGSDSGTSALSLHVTDEISKGSPFHWSASYNYLNGLQVKWNNSDLDFNTNTIDATLLYRHKIKSYNKFFRNVSIDYQAGLSVNLTDNKFTWPELNEEKYFSKKNDINGVVSVAANYKYDKSTSIQIGLKHLPSFSNFKSITTVYVGFTYKFVNAFGY